MKNQIVKGKFLMVEDRGPVSPGSSTSLYKVDTVLGTNLGTVSWHNARRRYVFLQAVSRTMDSSELTELVTFLDRATTEHKADWKQTKQKEKSLLKRAVTEPSYTGLLR